MWQTDFLELPFLFKKKLSTELLHRYKQTIKRQTVIGRDRVKRDDGTCPATLSFNSSDLVHSVIGTSKASVDNTQNIYWINVGRGDSAYGSESEKGQDSDSTNVSYPSLPSNGSPRVGEFWNNEDFVVAMIGRTSKPKNDIDDFVATITYFSFIHLSISQKKITTNDFNSFNNNVTIKTSGENMQNTLTARVK